MPRMTREKAIELLKALRDERPITLTFDGKEALTMAIIALESQISLEKKAS